MVSFIKCVIYLAGIGVGSFILGRVLSNHSFFNKRYLNSRELSEKEIAFYIALGVKKWKEKVPDMSTIFPRLMPSKKLPKLISTDHLKIMIEETYIAEYSHALLVVLGFVCIFLWEGLGGWLISVLYALGNLSFVIIQRYNRPKLSRLLERLEERELGGNV